MRHSLIFPATAALLGCTPTGPLAGATDSTTGAELPATTSGEPTSTDDGTSPSTSSSTTTATPGAMTTTGSTGDGTTVDATSTTTGDAGTTGDATTTGDASSTGEAPWAPEGCPEIFAQELLPTFELTLSQSELSKLHAEWLAADDNNTPEHPLLEFKYGDTVITDASARLRGNSKWWPEQGKMQLEVSFNTYDKKGRFMGLKHLAFDAAAKNQSFLKDRLALAVMRDVGLPAPCANNARLVLNGEYYGLFTSLEKVDSEFLERTFEDPDGNLYKRADWEKKTNEDDPDHSDVEALQDAETLDQLDAVMNLDEAILEWAAEAVIPDGDGAWAGGLNAYYYNDPMTGFVVIPWDKDATFTRLPFDTDPFTYIKPDDHGRPFYDIATADPAWFARYIDAIAHVLAFGYDVEVLQQRIDDWSAQIKEAAEDDPNKPFSDHDFHDAVEDQRDYVAKRAGFVAAWLECWQNGGTDTDQDGQCDPP